MAGLERPGSASCPGFALRAWIAAAMPDQDANDRPSPEILRGVLLLFAHCGAILADDMSIAAFDMQREANPLEEDRRKLHLDRLQLLHSSASQFGAVPWRNLAKFDRRLQCLLERMQESTTEIWVMCHRWASDQPDAKAARREISEIAHELYGIQRGLRLHIQACADAALRPGGATEGKPEGGRR